MYNVASIWWCKTNYKIGPTSWESMMKNCRNQKKKKWWNLNANINPMISTPIVLKFMMVMQDI